MWSTGMMNGIYYEVKHYAEGSIFGINEGRISKLFMRKTGKTYCNYDRGWDVMPDPEDQEAYGLYLGLLDSFN